MASLWTCGFETGNTLEWDTPGGAVATAPYARHGTYGWRSGTVQKVLPATYSELYLRVPNYSAGEGGSVYLYEGATLHIRVEILANGSLNVYRDATLIASHVNTFAQGQWRCLEIYVKIHDANGRVVCVWEMDYAHPVIDFTGDTMNGGTGLIDRVSFAAPTIYFVFDDLAINDTSGAVNNSWPGDGYGKILLLSGNGDSSQLVGSDGNSVDNYALVDEKPYNTTDWVQSNVPGEQDLYAVADPALAVNEIINAVRVVAIAKLDLPGVGSIKTGIKTASEDWGGAVALNDTTWRGAGKHFDVDPADGQPWTEAKVNSLQAGVQVA